MDIGAAEIGIAFGAAYAAIEAAKPLVRHTFDRVRGGGVNGAQVEHAVTARRLTEALDRLQRDHDEYRRELEERSQTTLEAIRTLATAIEKLASEHAATARRMEGALMLLLDRTGTYDVGGGERPR